MGALDAGLQPKYLKVEVTVDGVVLQGRELTKGHRVAQVAIGNGSDVGRRHRSSSPAPTPRTASCR